MLRAMNLRFCVALRSYSMKGAYSLATSMDSRAKISLVCSPQKASGFSMAVRSKKDPRVIAIHSLP